MGTFMDFESLPAELEHLWHEWHTVQFAFFIQSLENFLFAEDLNPIVYI
jgi:hypothetical protein